MDISRASHYLVGTAGIRHFSKYDHDDQIGNLFVCDGLCAIDSAQVIVVDMSEPNLIHMDLTIAQRKMHALKLLKARLKVIKCMP